MKQSAFIAFISLAVIMLLSIPYIPHHHHHGVCCNVVERCDIDHTDNDNHTSHHGDQTSCVEQANFLAGKTTSTQEQHRATLPLFTLLLPELMSEILLIVPTPPTILESKRSASLYAIDFADTKGLRAPPVAKIAA